MMQTLFVYMTMASQAWASEGAHEHAPHSPGWDVGLQAINFTLFAAVIYWLARKKVPIHFAARAFEFKQALMKAESAKKEADRKRLEIESRLALLESSADESLKKARAEAVLLRERMTAEAETMRATLESDARSAADRELERAKSELRAEMIVQSVARAQSLLKEQIADTDQKRLQTEFVEKIQAVSP